MRISLVVPSETSIYLMQIEVCPIEQHLAHHSPVSITLVGLHLNVAVIGQIAERLLRAVAKRLSFFWRVNPVESNLVLLLAAIQNREGDGG